MSKASIRKERGKDNEAESLETPEIKSKGFRVDIRGIILILLSLLNYIQLSANLYEEVSKIPTGREEKTKSCDKEHSGSTEIRWQGLGRRERVWRPSGSIRATIASAKVVFWKLH